MNRIEFVRTIRRLMDEQSITFKVLASVTPAVREPSRCVSDEMLSGHLLNERIAYEVPICAVIAWSKKLGPAVWTAWFAAQGLRFGCVPVSEVAAPADVIIAAAEAAREGGEAVAMSMAALADGVVSPAEKRQAKREIQEAVAGLQRLGAAMEAA